MDCEDQQIHTFKETLKLPGFSSCTSYNDAMNQYIDDRVYEKNRDMLRMALSFNSLFCSNHCNTLIGWSQAAM